MFRGGSWRLAGVGPAVASAAIAAGCFSLPPPLPDDDPAGSTGGGGVGGNGVGGAAEGGAADGGAATGGGGMGPGTPLPVCGGGTSPPACATATSVAIGDEFACALTDDGFVRCWGSNLEGQLGSEDLPLATHQSPTLVDGLSDVDEIVAGLVHGCALRAGKVYCWGGNAYAQLATGDLSPRNTPTEVPIPGVVSTISATSETTCALTVGGEVYCWGKAQNGQAWSGMALWNVPTAIAGLDGATFTRLEVANVHSCVATADGEEVRCWGHGDSGELGDGTSTTHLSAGPIAATAPTPLTVLKSGNHATCGLFGALGDVLCWGAMGLVFDDVPQPTPLNTVSHLDVVDIGLGWYHLCLLDSAKTVWCLGTNHQGQLGPINAGSTNVTSLPVEAANDVEALFAGWRANCARFVGGEIRCWGLNAGGEVDPTTLAQPVGTPTPILFER